MAYYFLFPEKDTTLYSHPDRDDLNTGHDEILEIVKERGTTGNEYYPSRALLKFKNEEIKTVIRDIIGHDNFNNTNVNLQLTAAEPRNIIQTLNLDFFAVSQSWDEGTGRYSNLPTSSNGASWIFRENSFRGNKWFFGQPEIAFIRVDGRINDDNKINTSSLVGNAVNLTGSFYLTTTTGDQFTLAFTSSVEGTNPFHFSASNTTSIISGTLVPMDISGSHSTPGTISSAEIAEVIAHSIGGSGPLSASFTASVSQESGDDSLIKITARSGSGNVGSNLGDLVNLTTRYQFIQGLAPSAIPPFSLFQTTASAPPAQDGVAETFAAGSTGSLDTTNYTGTKPEVGGGNWYTGSGFQTTQQFLVGDTLDINTDVTDICKKWSASLFNDSIYPTGIENNGFLIKQPDVIEEEITASFGELQYFSVDTHTIYPPKLSFKWDDSTFEDQYTSSIVSSNDSLNVTLYNNKKEYNQNDVAKFRIHVRDKYPTRQFASSSNYLNISYFPTSSHYSIRDAYTEQEIVPFDHTCTKLSADSKGMFFNVYMNGLQPERFYRVLFRSIVDDNDTAIYDNDYYFKVVR